MMSYSTTFVSYCSTGTCLPVRAGISKCHPSYCDLVIIVTFGQKRVRDRFSSHNNKFHSVKIMLRGY